MAGFASQMGSVAEALLGDANRSLSTKRELRFGNKGAVAVNLARGTFFDHESGEGGGVLDLIARETGLTGSAAFEWMLGTSQIEINAERRTDRHQRSKPAPYPTDRLSTPNQSWQRLWGSCRVITADDSAGRYLQTRGCALPRVDSDLKWHQSLRHPSGWMGPALVALITDINSCEPISLHRTWIDEANPGSKAPIERPRLLLRGHRKQGGVIRLWPDMAVSLGLAIGEGIETMLSAARGFEPVWSLIDSGNLAATPVLAGIDALTVVVDHDSAGLRAFEAIAKRWHQSGRDVRRVLIPKAGIDFNSWAADHADR